MEITNERKKCGNCAGHRGRICRYCHGTKIVPNIQDVVNRRLASIEKQLNHNYENKVIIERTKQLLAEKFKLKTKTPSKVTCTLTEGFVIHFD